MTVLQAHQVKTDASKNQTEKKFFLQRDIFTLFVGPLPLILSVDKGRINLFEDIVTKENGLSCPIERGYLYDSYIKFCFCNHPGARGRAEVEPR